jgi:hypothetical protein
MHELTLSSDFIAVAQGDGVLSAAEAFGLVALVEGDESDSVPEWLHDAVERLYLYSLEPKGTLQ